MDHRKWDDQMADLERFGRATGELPRRNARLGPDQVNPREDGLANFLHWQRRQKSTLSPDQVKRLEALPGFSWTPLTDAWEANVRDYGNFYLSHGVLPSTGSANPREQRLAIWAAEQRGLARGIPGRNPPTPERIEQLSKIPGWRWGTASDDRERRHRAELSAFITEHGRLPLNRRNRGPKQLTPREEDEGRLRRWLDRQAQKLKVGTLSDADREQLEAIIGGPLNSTGR